MYLLSQKCWWQPLATVGKSAFGQVSYRENLCITAGLLKLYNTSTRPPCLKGDVFLFAKRQGDISLYESYI